MSEKIEKSDREWKEILTPDEYYVCREKGTERAFTGEYWDVFKDGTYNCRACGETLFRSETKFDAGCGWPSFYEGIDKSKINEHEDLSYGMRRVEVTCAKCDSHLGHVFPDGPAPTGMRYCINSLSIQLDEDEGK
ncbi:peptide-methionine (R)-S-oxide reductase MsrB [Curvivirga sp.]|uniref:peptide-methionine (R)-S-oxide reductase MsrB n=1 Tax=Curvivirga sp. TaxID=2856848 RepID=UPI003B5B6061